MTPELLSLARYLASSRAGFALSGMSQYLSRQFEEKEPCEALHLDDFFCGSRFTCMKRTWDGLRNTSVPLINIF